MRVNRQRVIIITSTLAGIFIQPLGLSYISVNTGLKNNSFDVGFDSKVLAAMQTSGSSIRYTPPNRGTPDSTVAGGTRLFDLPNPGDVRDKPVTCSDSLIVPLVPEGHTGETTSGRPMFFWYVSDKVVPENSSQLPKVEFTLKQVGKTQAIFKKEIPISKPGLVPMELPRAQPEIMVGQSYVWSVSVVCYADSQYKRSVAEAVIRRINPPAQLTAQLKGVTSERDRAKVYAQNGFWYDALRALFKASSKENEEAVTNDIFSLLNQAGLTRIVEQLRG